MRKKSKADAIINEAADQVALRFVEEFHALRQHCESPIEELFLAGLFADHDNREFNMVFMGHLEPGLRNVHGETVYVYQQAKVGPYRTDFLILDASCPLEVSDPRWMVIECDGHDYHERTKEQAARDKKRDRFFASKGYKVLRFTGSEIWADPEAVAEEALGQLSRDDAWRNRDQ